MAVPTSYLRDENMRLLAQCCDCGRCKVVEIDQIIAKLGEDYPIPKVGRRILKCSVCGGRNIDSVPYWNDKQISGVQETYSYPMFE